MTVKVSNAHLVTISSSVELTRRSIRYLLVCSHHRVVPTQEILDRPQIHWAFGGGHGDSPRQVKVGQVGPDAIISTLGKHQHRRGRHRQC